MEEIKACPYCGSIAVETMETWGKYYVNCNDCNGSGPTTTHSKNEAVSLWNAAANQLAAKDAEIEQLRKERHTVCVDYERVEQERDEARRVARQLYATNKELISILTRSTLDGLDNFTRLEKLLATRNLPPTSVDKESE